jgi:conjugal transfer pilus assembly protein TraE
MDVQARQASIAELRRTNRWLGLAVAGLVVVALLQTIAIVTKERTVVMQIPGVPDEIEFRRNGIDRKGQQATVQAVVAALAQINPGNAAFQKRFLQAFLAPQAYTSITKAIDERVAQQVAQREGGSTYWVTQEYRYDPEIDQHFVIGDLHVVNVGKDTAQKFVFQLGLQVENYRPVVTSIESYPGERPHDSAWRKEQAK